jgi:positive regulator of sigma E activity
VLTKTPNKPWSSLMLAAFLGPPLGALLACVWAAIFRVGDPRSLGSIVVGDAIFVTIFAYPVVLAAILVYAMPLLWLALRFGFANPITALSVALFPGFMALEDASEFMNWLPLVICTGIAFVFIISAYRPRSNVA